MRRRHAHGTHLMQGHANAALGQRPGGLAAGETTADHDGV